jgi:hypothetical protein
MVAEICDRCDAVEECYEFLLAYAAQGLRVTRAASRVDKFVSSCIAPWKP